MNRLILPLFAVSLLLASARGDDDGDGDGGIRGRADYVVLETRDGKTFRNCFVKRSTVEGLVIEHEDGMAMVSFFDLSDEIREQYDFDPIEAMKSHRRNLEQSRRIRKQQLLEEAKRQALAEKKEAIAQLQDVAEEEWIPIEARIISVTGSGAYALVDRIVLKPTTVTSSLGFKNPGPAKRVTLPVRDAPLFLRNPDVAFSRDTTWKGYMEPFPTGMKSDPNTGEKTVPVHLAVPPP